MMDRRGFTLVELMIVIAIIAILAAIAIPNFLNFRLKAKVAEANANLAAIRTLETAFFAETELYITGQGWTPTHGADHSARVVWDSSTRFSQLGFAADSAVYYEYQLEPVGSLINSSFTAGARSDLDNNNMWAEYYINDAALEMQRTGDLY